MGGCADCNVPSCVLRWACLIFLFMLQEEADTYRLFTF